MGNRRATLESVAAELRDLRGIELSSSAGATSDIASRGAGHGSKPPRSLDAACRGPAHLASRRSPVRQQLAKGDDDEQSIRLKRARLSDEIACLVLVLSGPRHGDEYYEFLSKRCPDARAIAF